MRDKGQPLPACRRSKTFRHAQREHPAVTEPPERTEDDRLDLALFEALGGGRIGQEQTLHGIEPRARLPLGRGEQAYPVTRLAEAR